MRGYYGNFEDLKLLLRNSQFPACVCLQETLIGDKSAYPPSGYFIYTHHSTQTERNPRGIAMLVNKKIPHSKIDITSNLEIQAMKIHLNRTYTIVNAYISPQENVSVQQIDSVLSQLSPPYLIAGDFNARSPIWGDTTENRHGKTIERLLTTSDVTILNTGSPTHYHIQTNSESCIDLTFTSSNCLLDFSWQVTEDPYRSDHYPIYIDEITESQSNENQRYNFRKADLTTFKLLTQVNQEDLNADNNIDSLVQQFVTLITNAADNSIPKSNSENLKYPIPWWNAECDKIVSLRKAARRRYRRTGAIEDKIHLNRTTAIAKRTLKGSRLSSIRNYISSINSETPLSKIFKKFSKISGKYRPSPLPIIQDPTTNEILHDPQSTSNILCNHFSCISSISNFDPNFSIFKAQEEARPLPIESDNTEPYNDQISMREFKEALRKSKDTAPGGDNISYILLRNLDKTAQEFLLSIFNKIFSGHVFPESWRESILIPILKPNKPSLLPSSYRPIALTSCICKLMEKIINKRLAFTLEEIRYFSPYQYGFRKNRTTIDPLLSLQSDIYEAYARGEYLVAIFFDIKKAYDRTWKHLILKRLQSAGLRGHLMHFVRNFLNDRNIRVRIGSANSSTCRQEEGVPQGSVISCTLFTVAINGVLEAIPDDIGKSLYVDDLCIWYSSRHMPSLERKLQLALNNILEWTKISGFEFSPEKTVAVRFHNKRGAQPEPALTLGGAPILVETHTKYLGLILDEKMTWLKQITNLKERCYKALNLLKCISSKTWGSDRVALLQLYRSTVRPKLDYGCEVYSSAKPYILQKLDPVHHTALRLATGAYRSSPSISLCSDAGEMPLEKRRQALSAQLYIRLQRDPSIPSASICLSPRLDPLFTNSDSRIPFGTMARRLIRQNIPVINIIVHRPPELPPWRIPDHSFCTSFSAKKADHSENILKLKFYEHLNTDHVDSTHFYTDGSKSSAGVGMGIYNHSEQKSESLNRNSSIFTAELYAIFSCLMMILRRSETNFTIFSDSLSSIQAIEDMYSNNPLVCSIQTSLIRLSVRAKRVTFCWVPSHIGIPGNENADKLAKGAANNPQTPALFKNFYRDLYPAIKRMFLKQWEEQWMNASAIRANKLRCIKEKVQMWPSSSIPKMRLMERSICRLRIGHCHLTHKFLMERGRPPECEECACPLTVEHVLTECYDYHEARRQIYGQGRPNIKQILSEDHPDFNVEKLKRFLTMTELIFRI